MAAIFHDIFPVGVDFSDFVESVEAGSPFNPAVV
jgi:hypothetical protein